jgi:hypothetical protein
LSIGGSLHNLKMEEKKKIILERGGGGGGERGFVLVV